MFSISGISKSYSNQTLFAGVSFDVSARDRIALIGPNGSGKTTLFDIIAGEISPESLENFHKLKEESHFNDMSYAEKRKKDRDFGRYIKSAKKDLRKD